MAILEDFEVFDLRDTINVVAYTIMTLCKWIKSKIAKWGKTSSIYTDVGGPSAWLDNRVKEIKGVWVV